MIKINCESSDTLKLTDMVPFQGNLKKRTDQDIKELTDSLLAEGLMMPFAIWKHEGKNYLLDGHGRKEALTKLAVEDASMLSEEWPVIYINADTEDEARKALLQITSSYGKVTKQGYKQFCVSIPDYKAPVISKFIPKPVKVSKSEQAQKPKSDKTVLKIRVVNERVNQVLEIFKQFNFIEVL
jgi:hypothetical protein